MTDALVDNDILYKTAIYGLALPLIATRPYQTEYFYILGAARFMIAKKLSKHPPVRGAQQALAELESVLASLRTLEPNEQEVELAATLEYTAIQRHLQLDGGESMLCAMLINRGSDYLFTGDKRAITAIGALLSEEPGNLLTGRIVCLEQLFAHLVHQMGLESVRTQVCAEPQVDKSLTNCFACRTSIPPIESIFEGLSSYTNSIRIAAPGTLVETND